MSTPMEPSPSDNVYFNDPESGAEMARLIDQDRLITRGMGGPFADRPDLTGIHRILDVACGPGYVSAAVKQLDAIPTGIDFSEKMIAIAKGRSPDITFLQGNAQDLPFANAL